MFIIDFDGHKVGYRDDAATRDAGFERVPAFSKPHRAFTGASACQGDDVTPGAPNLPTDLADDALGFEAAWKD